MTHEFEVRKEITLDATPEEVWEAIATGPGVDSWFMGRNEIEPRVGGATRMTLGGQTEEATVTSWEPGSRLAYRMADNPDGTFMAFEYLVEGREGGGTVVRLVQSGMLGDDWETEYEAMNRGWDMYLHSLAQYLTYFRGRTARVVFAFRPQVSPQERVWEVLKGELGLTGEVRKGDKVHITAENLPPTEGTVDYVDLPTFLGVRTDDALYRFIHSGPERGDALILGHHLFTKKTDQKNPEETWQSWLDALPFR